jgi:beta-lactamase regulating signal transducer with metallopeptidase domain
MEKLLEIALSNAVLAGALAIPAAAATYFSRRPALTHALWLLVLLKLVTPPFIAVPVSWARPAASKLFPTEERHPLAVPAREDLAVLTSCDGMRPSNELHGPQPGPTGHVWNGSLAATVTVQRRNPVWQRAVPWAWLAGSCLCLLWIAHGVRQLRRLLRHAEPAPKLQEIAQRLAPRLGLSWCPTVCVVPGAVSPMLWAFGSVPCVLFPSKLLLRLDGAQIEAVLLHELAHLRRRDHWTRYLEAVATILFWWHPVLWWARRRIHEAEEQCCDAWVVWGLEGAGRAYALAILRTVELFSKSGAALPAGASGFGQVSHLRRRLTMIMSGNTPRSLSWAGCLLMLGAAIFLLPLLPVAAQAPRSDEGSKDPRIEQQIESLRRALRDLEKRAHASQPSTADERKTDEAETASVVHELQVLLAEESQRGENVAELQKEVERLRAQYESKRQALQAAERRYREAEQRLATVQARVKDGSIHVRVVPAKPGHQGRGEDLESRLDRLIREISQLKRDLRQQKQQRPDDPFSDVPRTADVPEPPMPPVGAVPVGAPPALPATPAGSAGPAVGVPAPPTAATVGTVPALPPAPDGVPRPDPIRRVRPAQPTAPSAPPEPPGR